MNTEVDRSTASGQSSTVSAVSHPRRLRPICQAGGTIPVVKRRLRGKQKPPQPSLWEGDLLSRISRPYDGALASVGIRGDDAEVVLSDDGLSMASTRGILQKCPKHPRKLPLILAKLDMG